MFTIFHCKVMLLKLVPSKVNVFTLGGAETEEHYLNFLKYLKEAGMKVMFYHKKVMVKAALVSRRQATNARVTQGVFFYC